MGGTYPHRREYVEFLNIRYNLTATTGLAVAFCRAILILFSKPGELFTNFAFQAA